YKPVQVYTDTSLYFTVQSPVPLEKAKKISMYPENMQNRYGMDEEDASLIDGGVFKEKLVVNDSTGEKIYVSLRKPSRYYQNDDTLKNENPDSMSFKTSRMDWTYLSKKKYELPNRMKVLEYIVGDPKSSRYVYGKLFSRDGVDYRLESLGDIHTGQSAFIKDFYSSFTPSDTVKGVDVRAKKSPLFFADFFSSDTLQHKRAVKNLSMVEFDSTDFPQLKKAILSLNWGEKKYMDVKNEMVWNLSTLKSRQSADFLKEIYFAAGDTIDLQYTALEALLYQQTDYAFGVFRDIMISEPPVLGVGNGAIDMVRSGSTYTYPSSYQDYDYERSGSSFLEVLNDSLKLTSTIFKDLLPLININDYEQPIMELLGDLIDSNLIAANDYEQYSSRFLIEARQLLKKQLIREKNRSIERAQEEEEDRDRYDQQDDFGNSQLSLYATLLMPFWDKNPAVPALFNQLLASNDKKLKYSTTMLMLRHQKKTPDSLLKYFASLDDYRYFLYRSLKSMGRLKQFPAGIDHAALAKSKLISMTSNYNRPDTIAFVEKLPVQHKERSGFVYFFKYKQKKDDNSWKLATIGIVPAQTGAFEFEPKSKYYEEIKYNFSELNAGKIEEDEPLKEQLEKLLKKMKYSKRNSAAEFYRYDQGNNYDFMETISIGE
ncbi:MAG: hypothetical protein ACXWV0_08080, partial [Flavisolibacter sp.]